MNDDQLRDLLSEAVDDVEPRYALDDIRSRTTTPRRRWPYAAGGAVLAVAASVTAFTLLTDGGTTPRATDPVSSPSSSPTPSASATPSEPSSPTDAPPPSASATPLPAQTVAVYYVGETPDGPRLYREFRPADRGGITDLGASIIAVLTSQAQDPDYRNMWPATGAALRSAEVVDGVIRVDLLGFEAAATQSHGLPEVERRLAIEQVIFTAQAAVQERLPVQFLVDGNPSAEILGLPASEPLTNGPVLDTLALVSLTTPAEGMVVDNDEPLMVEGAGNSFEGNIVTWVEDTSGEEVVGQEPVIAGWIEEKLFPYTVNLDLTGLAPGDYLVVSSTDDPSGRGREHTDTRQISVVD